ncbi:hypothetical protein [Chitinophaga ginsengisoli]|uniref:Uncharacterized protein n=1 Tax=Chitinophaga ginsengisoli TaxID=363837 RepID=A0A2P8FXC4_9BACT|nr:hypothetical protein [Chitinophaga ginsengisoli]PSL26373.1 hypothetical protein CLV42_11184 [Chitinophaga ginsengisoli]
MKKVFVIVILIIVFIAIAIYLFCKTDDQKTAKNIYNKRTYLLKEFKDKTILNRSDKFYQLSYSKGQLVNTFFFEKNDSTFTFTNEILQYPLTDIAVLSSFNVTDTSGYRNALGNELRVALKVMDHFKIIGVTADFRKFGIDMKIYIESYGALLYVRDVTDVKNEQWKKYIESGRKLDESWYLVKDK